MMQGFRVQTSVTRRHCPPICAQKGFGDGDAPKTKKAADKKVSKRGKVATRPSELKQLEKLQAEEREYQAAVKAKLEARGVVTPAANQSPPPTLTPSTSAFEPDDDDDDDSSSSAIPEQITDRMLRRMITFSIAPVMGAFTLFPLFYYLRKVQDIDVPVWAVYIVQTIIFGGGLLGISYGILSTSWDQRREGSALGWSEFKGNLPIVMDRFRKKD